MSNRTAFLDSNMIESSMDQTKEQLVEEILGVATELVFLARESAKEHKIELNDIQLGFVKADALPGQDLRGLVRVVAFGIDQDEDDDQQPAPEQQEEE